MNRYDKLFARLAKNNESAFVPFVTLGDPDPALSLQIIETLITSGADALELGIPFSDPLADGPTIQAANLRAFAGGVTISRCFEMLAYIRQKYPDMPIGLLIYANLVFSNGIDNFYARCQTAGVDSVLIADVPVEESAPFRQSAEKHQIAPIFICPPDANAETIQQIARYSQGYTYLVSRAGVTGAEHQATAPLTHIVNRLRAAHAAPAIQGFGISTPEHVKLALQSGVSGAIAGSATVKIIEQYHDQPPEMLKLLAEFVSKMKYATHLAYLQNK